MYEGHGIQIGAFVVKLDHRRTEPARGPPMIMRLPIRRRDNDGSSDCDPGEVIARRMQQHLAGD